VNSRDDLVPEFFWPTIEADIAACRSVDAAAQMFCDQFYRAFGSFTALVRMFVTSAVQDLPEAEAAFASTFLSRAGEPATLAPDTPVLTLVGTRGIEPAWGTVAQSREHRAIPLISDDFIDGIPMIARLLGEIGFPRLSGGPAAWQFVTRDIVDVNGLFFVGDARTTTDERGRHIIPSVDFVERYGIRTVFGFGGPYTATPTFLTAIIFARRPIDRAVAARYVHLIANFKAATRDLVTRNAVFSSAAG
jgi:hypothetical protein